MTRYIIIFAVLIMNKGYAQNEYKLAQGFYDLSRTEVASGIYLLENETFFYYATFGSVDLRVFGSYKIRNDSLLTFQPHNELIQEFYIYGTTTKARSDTITIHYQRPYEEKFENLTVNTRSFPQFNSDNNTVSISIKKPDSMLLKFEYPGSFNRKEYVSLQLTNNINELLIFHNYYAHMVRNFASNSFRIGNGIVVVDSQKANKKEINQKVVGEIIAFIEKLRNDNTLNREEKTYQKLIIAPNSVNKKITTVLGARL